MTLNRVELAEAVESILIPIQRIITRILSDYVEKDLKDTSIREMIVEAADIVLCVEVPAARSIPEDVRKTLIRKLLHIMFDDIVLPARIKKTKSEGIFLNWS